MDRGIVDRGRVRRREGVELSIRSGRERQSRTYSKSNLGIAEHGPCFSLSFLRSGPGVAGFHIEGHPGIQSSRPASNMETFAIYQLLAYIQVSLVSTILLHRESTIDSLGCTGVP